MIRCSVGVKSDGRLGVLDLCCHLNVLSAGVEELVYSTCVLKDAYEQLIAMGCTKDMRSNQGSAYTQFVEIINPCFHILGKTFPSFLDLHSRSISRATVHAQYLLTNDPLTVEAAKHSALAAPHRRSRACPHGTTLPPAPPALPHSA